MIPPLSSGGEAVGSREDLHDAVCNHFTTLSPIWSSNLVRIWSRFVEFGLNSVFSLSFNLVQCGPKLVQIRSNVVRSCPSWSNWVQKWLWQL